MTTPERIRRRQWLLISVQGATAILATIALLLSVATNAKNISLANTERTQARYSNCLLLRQIVLVATPRARQSRALAFLAVTPLANCERYATSTR